MKKIFLLAMLLILGGAGCEINNIYGLFEKAAPKQVQETPIDYDDVNTQEQVVTSSSSNSQFNISFGLESAACEFLGTRQSFNITIGQIKLLTFWVKTNGDAWVENYPMDVKFNLAKEVYADKLYIRKKGSDSIQGSPVHLDRYVQSYEDRVKALGGDFVIRDNNSGDEVDEYYELMLDVIYPTFPITEPEDKVINFNVELPVKDWLIADKDYYIPKGVPSDLITVEDRVAAFCVVE